MDWATLLTNLPIERKGLRQGGNNEVVWKLEDVVKNLAEMESRRWNIKVYPDHIEAGMTGGVTTASIRFYHLSEKSWLIQRSHSDSD